MTDPIMQFDEERRARINNLGNDESFQSLSKKWLEESMRRQYCYNFNWLGRPVIQNPADIVGMQELIWSVKPELIIETGIAHGGSLIFSASMLALNEICGGASGIVVAGDIDIRSHNRQAIENHPLSKYITMIEGSSIGEDVIAQVRKIAEGKKRVLVCLDSNHTHDHVMAELEAYAPLVSVGSYCVVFDSFVEDMPKGFFADRPWDVGNNPKTAVHEWLKQHEQFEIDAEIENKLMVTVAPDGFLKRVR
jgi:cephalosporin hydroxylase